MWLLLCILFINFDYLILSQSSHLPVPSLIAGYQRKCIKGWWTSIIVYGIIGLLVTAGFATGVGGAIGGGIFAICAKAVGSFLGENLKFLLV